MKHKSKHQRQTVTISSGELRHRRVHFVDADHLRPTTSRVRETLFNWLQPIIYGTTCLDLFAGSGILGFEAISRGAKKVTFVENNRSVATHIKSTIKELDISRAEVLCLDYQQALTQLSGPVDIIFLDPPYDFELLPELLKQLAHLSPQWIFIEDRQPFDTWVPQQKDYALIKSKKAGKVFYGLLQAVDA